jgi:hypothetical protein
MFALAGVTLAALASAARGQAIIGTKKLVLGVGELGNLNIPYKGDIPNLLLPSADPLKVNFIGLRNGNGRLSGVERGCLCEGWGVGVASNPTAPFSFLDSCGVSADTGPDNVIAEGFSGTDGGVTARSRTICGSQKKIRVTHDYAPSSETSRLFKVKVTIKNLTKKPFPQVIYRRAMDWDIHPIVFDPNDFSEFVTIKGTGNSNYASSNDNGFCPLNPAIDCAEIAPGTTDVDFVDSGPLDHGAQFKLKFGKLKAGHSLSFTTYYGVAPDEKSANDAVNAVGAELYSFGQSKKGGKPATFIWAYNGDKSIKKGKGFLPGLVAPPPTAEKVSVGPSAEERQKSNSG